ncbi:hypothetical protein N7468_001863 [Penicillium chermesinum]|uniref:Uncharacterized protein n=1 Tax=Penicillium chermesinum TaxID=63820 RepID=A0A9W9TX36_9EURO|nr:uncharacterized protein N7468_001863 [Penicillium chermesinum]KAJ5246880.1 hypothetical protein N7468_001863 [Penicillium chermesinum]
MAPDVASLAQSTAIPASKVDGPVYPADSIDLKRLLRHDLVTKDFDELRFEAASARQLLTFVEASERPSSELDTRLVASPYNEASHLLDINTVDAQSRYLALALAYLRPTRDDYAVAGYLESFNWDEVFDIARRFAESEGHTWTSQSFYVVSFRSTLLPNIDQDHLYALDAHSHQEAVVSGGLLKYWFGKKNEREQNLATCVWRNRNDARLGGRGPWHAKARAAGRQLYESIIFKTMKLTIEDGVKSWSFSDWTAEGEK